MHWVTKRRSRTAAESTDSGITLSELLRRKRVRIIVALAVLIAFIVGASSAVQARSKQPTSPIGTTTTTAETIAVPTTLDAPMVSTTAVSVVASEVGAPAPDPTVVFEPTCATNYSSDGSTEIYLELDDANSVKGYVGTTDGSSNAIIEQVSGTVRGKQIELVGIDPDGSERMMIWQLINGGIQIEDGTFVQIGPCSGD